VCLEDGVALCHSGPGKSSLPLCCHQNQNVTTSRTDLGGWSQTMLFCTGHLVLNALVDDLGALFGR
jgi:hypothetical protein